MVLSPFTWDRKEFNNLLIRRALRLPCNSIKYSLRCFWKLWNLLLWSMIHNIPPIPNRINSFPKKCETNLDPGHSVLAGLADFHQPTCGIHSWRRNQCNNSMAETHTTPWVPSHSSGLHANHLLRLLHNVYMLDHLPNFLTRRKPQYGVYSCLNCHHKKLSLCGPFNFQIAVQAWWSEACSYLANS